MSSFEPVHFQRWTLHHWDKESCIARAGELEPLLDELFAGEDWTGFGQRLGWRSRG